MKLSEVRKKYLDFFEKRGHKIVPAASLLPENDPTTLFTGSGMQPMVPFLLGQPHPLGKRISDSQTCFRSQDIDEVGDNRHTTFFEMLGNWSLGDYFKKEQIEWMFEFLTKEIGLDPEKLFVTVFCGNESLGIQRDSESVEFWKKAFLGAGIDAVDVDFSERDGLQNGRIFYYDEEKNWWSRSGVPDNMPVGEPGGPDSEMFWDFGEELKLHENSQFKNQPCHVNCDCGRFLEIGNNVFMQYKKTETGFETLPNKNVDFGGGLERITAASNNTPDIFLIDVLEPMRLKLEELSKRRYNSTTNNNEVFLGDTRAFRVIMDHIRAVVFLIADGVTPSNKDQGYFARRLIRRAVRFGKKIGIQKTFCSEIGQIVVQTYNAQYPHLEKQQKTVLEKLLDEENKFLKTLIKGEYEFEKFFSEHGKISGQDAFVLYTTYGFPLELTEEMALEKGQVIDKKIFAEESSHHQELSRAGSAEKFAGGLADHSEKTVKLHTATHMLNQALRTVLGDHVFQRGSNITHERLRFDFSHPERLTDEQIKQVESIVNENIKKNLLVHFEILNLDEAKKRGAIGVFEDKYASLGDKIKVYFIGDSFSKEVCGGPHVSNTSELGSFKILKEESVGSGIRRIKASLI
ncbi:alanine--tRNA ligase [Candidatus Uhrbacteria bacterium]|nr:alanine--tRNA ligase [Candidatus Uhrbacteria bacterium]